jgi:hypothetical protein
MPRYNQFISYSPMHDCRVARISMVFPPSPPGAPPDRREGAEYFAFPAEPEGRVYRERWQKALEAIEDAIARGLDPGEVTLVKD